MRYHVDFSLDGKPKSIAYDTGNPGAAFAKCLQENRGAILIKAWHKGLSVGYCEFDPPPVQREPVKDPRPCRAPKSNELEAGVMPFYDEARSLKR